MSVFNHPSTNKYTLTSYEKVNFSSAQQKYSFGKADRFPNIKNFSPPVTGYDNSSSLNKKGAGIGYGDKNIFKAVERNSGKYLQINSWLTVCWFRFTFPGQILD